MTELDTLRFPTGRFQPQKDLTAEDRDELITALAHFPADLRFLVESISEKQLDTPYREGGWTIRQVVHHIPDSHMQGYARFKLALTENNPTIKTYEEASWAELEDARTAPVSVSLDLLEALHARWALLLRGMSPEEFARTIRHPELGEVTLATNLQLYVWHGRHHLGHVRLVAEG